MVERLKAEGLSTGLLRVIRCGEKIFKENKEYGFSINSSGRGPQGRSGKPVEQVRERDGKKRENRLGGVLLFKMREWTSKVSVAKNNGCVEVRAKT
jgi:uncharacterized C2H2 Zn-finger protein